MPAKAKDEGGHTVRFSRRLHSPVFRMWCLYVAVVALTAYPMALATLGELGWVSKHKATLIAGESTSGTTEYTEYTWTDSTYRFKLDDGGEVTLKMDEQTSLPAIGPDGKVVLGTVLGGVASVNGKAVAPAGYFTLLAFGMSCGLLVAAIATTVVARQRNGLPPIDRTGSLVYGSVLLLASVPAAVPAVLTGTIMGSFGLALWPLMVVGAYALVGVFVGKKIARPHRRRQ